MRDVTSQSVTRPHSRNSDFYQPEEPKGNGLPCKMVLGALWRDPHSWPVTGAQPLGTTGQAAHPTWEAPSQGPLSAGVPQWLEPCLCPSVASASSFPRETAQAPAFAAGCFSVLFQWRMPSALSNGDCL